jgi:succinyl-diaminopimelate desuccinylase
MPDLLAVADEHSSAVVDFCQRIVRIPSLPGQEGDVANLVQLEMNKLGYDEITVDEVGNVVGTLQGDGNGPSVEFNGHMDVVDVGDPSRWPYPPFGGEIHGGAIWGRGASDMKGALAAMIYGAALPRRLGLHRTGDVHVAAVVMEETGGLGTIHLTKRLRPSAAVVGEASRGAIARGHRGRCEIVVKVTGKSVHASVPEQGANPHYTLAAFIEKLHTIHLSVDSFLGPASLAPTLFLTDQRSANVTPGECALHLDWRNVAGDDPEVFLSQLRELLGTCLRDGCTGEVRLQVEDARTYTGKSFPLASVFPPFVLPTGHPLIGRASQALTTTFGSAPSIIRWSFATDGGHLMRSGIPVIGYGPADERLAHTVEDRIEIGALVRGIAGYAALALALPTGDGV